MLYHTWTPAEAAEHLGTDIHTGLSEAEAKKRLEQYGPNQLQEAKGKSTIKRFLAQFADFMILVLIAAAGISFFVSLSAGDPDLVEPGIILSIILLNAILGVVQEAKAERSLAALKKLSAPSALVLRDKHLLEVPAATLVPGDIIRLETGHYVPADARLLSCEELKIDESALTGESLPVKKKSDMVCAPDTPAADRKNLVYASGLITYGHGMALVTATGMHTQVGQIATLILTETEDETPLQKRMEKTGKMLGLASLCICALIFVTGLLQGRPVISMFMTSVSLAVAAIPEGLPAVITIMLSLGVQRMAAKHAIIRRLPTVEALGNATVICSDKTGTLTQNRMSVVELYTQKGCVLPTSHEGNFLLSLSALCTNATQDYGEATELALVTGAKEAGISKPALELSHPRIYEIPFDSARKRMSTIHRLSGGKYRVITKGAPDYLYPLCHFSGPDEQKQLEQHQRDMAASALRVLAVAYRDIEPHEYRQEDTFLESKLTFAGLVGMMDPPRPEVPLAVSVCKKAGVRPIMITGDHAATACAIAEKIGLISSGTLTRKMGMPSVLTGSQLESMDEATLRKAVRTCSVFARVSPTHKVRIVKALQANGELVAMTGDGINDAAALKVADIGCAMGQGGTDVAKDASDMILADDNFATIVSAIEEGRGIYDNIRKAIHFLLSCNIGEIITIFSGVVFGLPTPLSAVQLLWVNLVTDSLPAIALGTELLEKDIMKRKPNKASGSFFTPSLTFRILAEGAMIGWLALLAFVLGLRYGTGSVSERQRLARTLCFCVLSLSQLFHSFNMRSNHSLFSKYLHANPRMYLSFLICACLQIGVVMIPACSSLFSVTTLSLGWWLIVLLISFVPIPLMELQKWQKRHKSQND